MTTYQYKKFSVLEPTARVVVSRDAKFCLQFQPGEPAKLYDISGSFPLRITQIPEFEGTDGAISYNQLTGCTEVAIIGDDCIFRYSISKGEVLKPVAGVSASAIAYNAGSTAMFVAEESGKISVHVIDEDGTHCIQSFNSGYTVSAIFPHSFNDTFTATGNGQLIMVDPLNSFVEEIELAATPEESVGIWQITSATFSAGLPLVAIATRDGFIYAANLDNGAFTLFEVSTPVEEMVFLETGKDLVIATGTQVDIIDLSEIIEPEESEDIFLQGETVLMPPATKIWALRVVGEELRIVYE